MGVEDELVRPSLINLLFEVREELVNTLGSVSGEDVSQLCESMHHSCLDFGILAFS